MINNPTIYKREYRLCRSQVPGQYLGYSLDTPRGILRYNSNKSFPYLIFAEASTINYDVSIGYAKLNSDVYKTTINPNYVPSPTVDVKCDKDYPVKIIELYSPTT